MLASSTDISGSSSFPLDFLTVFRDHSTPGSMSTSLSSGFISMTFFVPSGIVMVTFLDFMSKLRVSPGPRLSCSAVMPGSSSSPFFLTAYRDHSTPGRASSSFSSGFISMTFLVPSGIVMVTCFVFKSKFNTSPGSIFRNSAVSPGLTSFPFFLTE